MDRRRRPTASLLRSVLAHPFDRVGEGLMNAPPRRRYTQSENQAQRAVLARLDLSAPKGTIYFHIPNGGYRKPVEAAILKSLGVIAGMPDLCIIYGGRAFFLEMKAERGGRLSEKQIVCHQRLRDAGAVVMTAAGVDEAVAALQNMGILPGGAS
jgi:hypothetical protein